MAMTDFEPQEDLPPVAHVTIVYNGPVAPHWDLRVRYGDQKMLDDFWARVNARLLLLPKHDPQFRRNKERVNRDAERELIICDWDLGDDDADTTITPVVEPVAEAAIEAEEGVSVAEVSTTEDAVVQEAEIEDAVFEVPTTEDAVAEDPVTEEAVVEEAVIEDAVAEDPAVEETVSADMPADGVASEGPAETADA